MNVQMNAQAAALLKRFQISTAEPLPAKVEQALAAAVTQQDQVLDAKQVEQVLLQAMPNQKQCIQDCAKFVQGYHCDNTNGQFLTQLLSTRVEKDVAAVWRQPNRPTRTRKDPYFADMQMDPKADFIMLFNARDVDEKGQPLLMKIIARERADLSKIDLSNYRTQGDKDDVSKFDVMTVKDNADFIQMKDTDEMEFNFGDPLLAVSLGGKAEEISSTVKVAPENQQNREFYQPDRQGRPDMNRPVNRRDTQTGHTLDTTNVQTFSDRVRLAMSVKDTAPEGAWLDDRIGDHLDVQLNVDHGYMYEPGSSASVAFLGTRHNLSVKPDDAQLLGTQSVSGDVTVAANYTMRNVLTQPINQRSHAGPTGTTDQANTNTPAHQLIYREPNKIQIGGKFLQPLKDVSLAAADFDAAGISVHKHPRAGDAERDGQTVHLELKKGFLKGLEDMSVKGYKVVAGFVDADGTWKQASEATLRNSKESEKLEFDFDLDDAPAVHQQNKNLEVRVFNADGVPAERVLIPFRQIGWGS
jgi:hypothetical protein